MAAYGQVEVPIPRIVIKFCVGCKWNLRAAYYAQELLQTFSTAIGEVSLVPVTGGIFTVTLYHHEQQQQQQQQQQRNDKFVGEEASKQGDTASTPDSKTERHSTTAAEEGQAVASTSTATVTQTQIWDRKTDGGFPETKELKNRIRNVIEPDRDMGHIDRSLKKKTKDMGMGGGAGVGAGTDVEVQQPEVPVLQKEAGSGGSSNNKNLEADHGLVSGSVVSSEGAMPRGSEKVLTASNGKISGYQNHSEHVGNGKGQVENDCEECRQAAAEARDEAGQ